MTIRGVSPLELGTLDLLTCLANVCVAPSHWSTHLQTPASIPSLDSAQQKVLGQDSCSRSCPICPRLAQSAKIMPAKFWPRSYSRYDSQLAGSWPPAKILAILPRSGKNLAQELIAGLITNRHQVVLLIKNWTLFNSSKRICMNVYTEMNPMLTPYNMLSAPNETHVSRS